MVLINIDLYINPKEGLTEEAVSESQKNKFSPLSCQSTI
jgi:hypothetical protein